LRHRQRINTQAPSCSALDDSRLLRIGIRVHTGGSMKVEIKEIYKGIFSIFIDDKYLGHITSDPFDKDFVFVNFDARMYKSPWRHSEIKVQDSEIYLQFYKEKKS
jgi:hypothetical protein